MLYIITNSKGGVGKSLASAVTACLLHEQGKKFKIIEIDDHNRSIGYDNSDIINKDNATMIALDEKDNELSNIFFDVMDDPELDYILDIGGSHNTDAMLPLLKEIEFEKKYIIPVGRSKTYISNADDTAALIDDPANTYFLLNQYFDKNKIEDEFRYFFGNSKLNIKSASKFFNKDKFLMLPFGNSFQAAEDENQTILDLANISQGITQQEAINAFYEKSKKDRNKFNKMMAAYWNSVEAADLFKKIQVDFSKLFEK